MMEENKVEEKVDMSFREMIENLFDISWMTPHELTTICAAAEMYADAKVKNSKKENQKT